MITKLTCPRLWFPCLLAFAGLMPRCLMAQTDLFWGDTQGGIERGSSLGTVRQPLIPASVSKAQGLAMDIDLGYIYWTDWVADHILRARLDGSGMEVLVDEGLELPEGLALDKVHGLLYWVDSGTGTIERMRLDGSQREVLVSYRSVNLDDIALDVAAGKMYWTEWGAGAAVGKVKRAQLDGSNVEVLVEIRDGILKGIDLDLEAGKVYWTDCGFNNIGRANLDGSEQELVVEGLATPNALVVDPVDKLVYWTDLGFKRIERARLNGSKRQVVFDTGVNSLQALAMIRCEGTEITCLEATVNRPEPLEGLELFPNPAREVLFVRGLPPNCQVEAFDGQGRLLFREQAFASEVRVGLQGVPPGLVLVRIRQQGRLLGRYQVVKR